MGLIVRALGAGLKVLFVQFMKSRECSEHKILLEFSNLTLRRYGSGKFVHGKPSENDTEAGSTALAETRTALESGEYDLVVLDEANVAVKMGVISVAELLSLVNEKPEKVEVVITGRGAPSELIERADLVTEMREIKHYYHHGVKARRGIEE
jgi:cob(I)alamin adenosyltransferase